MGPTPLDAVIFDVDGTLVDTYRLYLESYRRALAPFVEREPTIEEIVAARPSSERRFLASLVDPDRLDECHARMCEHYDSLHASHGDGMYDGVREMLVHLRSAGIPIAIVTGKGRRAWESTARHWDLGGLEIVVTEDDVGQPKPHPEGLIAAAVRLGLQPSGIAYIGDSLIDFEAARAAGMRSGAALWPKTAPGEAERFSARATEAGAEWLFARPADVSRTFAPWC